MMNRYYVEGGTGGSGLPKGYYVEGGTGGSGLPKGAKARIVTGKQN